MNVKTKEFIKDLKELCEKHSVRLDEADDYDGADEYCGTTYSFSGIDNEIYIDMSDVSDEI